jgi:uncharacterized protein (TIGR02145 family)
MKKNGFALVIVVFLFSVILSSCSEDKTLPAVDFTIQSQGNLVGDQIHFSDNTKNQPVSWDWSFPGGTPSKSTLQNPVVVYNAAGTYSVTLTATNADGSATAVKNNCIKIMEYNTFTDSRDGKTYKSMKIGNEEWMIQNLDYQTPTGSYVYKSLTNYETLFGRVYDWATAQTVAPQGWHLPSDSEFTALVKYLGGNIIAGGKMKTGGTILWTAPNTGATNISGFNALPAGGRYSGNFTGIYTSAFFWTSTANGSTEAWSFAMYHDDATASRNSEPREWGMSVRCVKDL